MTVEELVKAYRDLRARDRQRVKGDGNFHSYPNAGIEAMAANRRNAANRRFVQELMALQVEFHALPEGEGEKLLVALTAEANALDRRKSARAMADGSWDRIGAAVRKELVWHRAEVKTLVHVVNTLLEAAAKTETQQAVEEALETMAEAAKGVFREELACLAVYLGPGAHEGDQHSWNVYAYRDNEYVGTVQAVFPTGPGGRVEYEGVLFSEIGPTFRVTDLVIATVLLHLGIELGRREQKKAAR